MKYNYSNITILQFQQICSAIEHCKDNEIRLSYNIMSILTGQPLEYYQKMKWGDLKKEMKDVDSSTMPETFEKEFTIQGEIFKIVQHPTDWNTEQFISMSNLTKDNSQIIPNLHVILAVMTDNGKENTQVEIDRRSELFLNHLPIGIAYPTGFFFAALLVGLLKNTPTSLIVRMRLKSWMMKLKRKYRKLTGILKPGGGTLLWITSRVVTNKK